MYTPEKNDINISALLSWKKMFELEIPESDEKLTVFIRLPGDSDINKARVYAVRKSNELRKLLKDISSDEYAITFNLLDSNPSKDELVNTIVALSFREVSQESLKEATIPYPKEPSSTAPLEKVEKYQEELDTYMKRREEKIKSFMEKRLKQIEAQARTLTESELLKLYMNRVTDETCENEMYVKFKDYCVFSSCYKDESYTTRLFSSVEDFQNLPTELKVKFESAYDSLDLKADDLKK